MRKRFSQLPGPLQRVILFRLSGVLFGGSILILALVSGSNWMLIFPAVVIMLYALFSAFVLFLECSEGSILTIEGSCSSLEQSVIRKRIQAIYLRSDYHDIRIVCRYGKVRDIRPGDTITVFLREKTPVYEMEGYQVICDYLAFQKSSPRGNQLAH